MIAGLIGRHLLSHQQEVALNMKSRKKKRKVFCCCRRKVASSDDEGNLNSKLLLCQQLCKSFRSVKAGEGMFVDVARSRVYTKLSALVHDYYLCNSKIPNYQRPAGSTESHLVSHSCNIADYGLVRSEWVYVIQFERETMPWSRVRMQ